MPGQVWKVPGQERKVPGQVRKVPGQVRKVPSQILLLPDRFDSCCVKQKTALASGHTVTGVLSATQQISL